MLSREVTYEFIALSNVQASKQATIKAATATTVLHNKQTYTYGFYNNTICAFFPVCSEPKQCIEFHIMCRQLFQFSIVDLIVFAWYRTTAAAAATIISKCDEFKINLRVREKRKNDAVMVMFLPPFFIKNGKNRKSNEFLRIQKQNF